MEAYEDCQGVTFAGVGLDSLIAAWQAFEKSRTTAKGTDPKFLTLLNGAIKAQKSGHELHLTTEQVIDLVGHLELPLDSWISLQVFNCHLENWIRPLSPPSRGVSFHFLDFEMDRTRDYSIGLSFDDKGEIVFGPQMNTDGIEDLSKRVFFLGVAITEKLETWRVAGKGGKLAFIELCAMRRLFFFEEVPTKLQEMQHPQLLTLTKLLRASKKKEGADRETQAKESTRFTSFQWSVKTRNSRRERIVP
jgi:hypothetical protein